MNKKLAEAVSDHFRITFYGDDEGGDIDLTDVRIAPPIIDDDILDRFFPDFHRVIGNVATPGACVYTIEVGHDISGDQLVEYAQRSVDRMCRYYEQIETGINMENLGREGNL